MKWFSSKKSGVALSIALLACTDVLAYGGHGGGHWRGGGSRVGVHIGLPLFSSPFYGYAGTPNYQFGYSPGYYPYPYSSYYGYAAPATTILVPAPEPVEYIERSQAPSAGYWYYCREPAGYYPTVPNCARTWQKIPPSTPQ